MTTRIDSSLLARIPGITTPLNRAGALLHRLNLNQALQGRVLSVHGSQVVISLLGEQIAAESLLSLQVGQVLDLMVREVRPDQVTLQVAPETREEAPAFRPIADQDLSDLLAAQHLLPNHTNLLIARTLIHNSLPITKALVIGTRKALSFIDAPTEEEMDAAIYLLLKDLPVTPESLELAKGGLLQPNNLGARIQALAAQLLELLVQAEPDGATAMLSRPLLAITQQVLQNLLQLVPDHAQSQTFTALIPQVLDQIATPTERRIARLLENAGLAPSGREALPSPTTAKGAVIIESQRLPSDEHPGTAQEDGREGPAVLIRHQPLEISRDFRQQLTSLNDALAQASAELPTHHRLAPLLRELGVTIREMITMVEAEQLSNAGLPPPTQPQGYYVFNLPIAAAGQDATDTAEVRIYYQRRGHTKRVDPENAHLAFLLEMSHLGPVDVHVDLYQKHLRCRIECPNHEAVDLFQASSPELQGRLQVAGYTVDSIRTVIATRPSARSDRESMPPLFKIDIRA